MGVVSSLPLLPGSQHSTRKRQIIRLRAPTLEGETGGSDEVTSCYAGEGRGGEYGK